MNAPAASASPIRLDWPAEGISRVPYRVYTDPDLYALEQQRIFRGPAWNFLGLAAEVPNAGDFKATFVGDTPVDEHTTAAHDVRRLFSRPVRVRGTTRQYMNTNRKVYAENSRDPSHASPLHLFHCTLGWYRSTQESRAAEVIEMEGRGVKPSGSLISEGNIRAFWQVYRQMLGL